MKNVDFYITGDTHGKWDKLLFLKDKEPLSCAVIILGDFGANFAHDQLERSRKDTLNSFGNYIYAVRGNHDDRPEEVENMKLIYDENVKGEVYCQTRRWPNIRYFKDGGQYEINGLSVLVIGGAYSVDKDFRLIFGYPYCKNELLSPQEMDNIYNDIKGKHFNFVLTHTCPISWQPTDLFLKTIDQNKVDKSMEKWFEILKDEVKYDIWMFGHFHDDRIVRPHVEMMYNDVQKFEDVYWRWKNPRLDSAVYTWSFDPKYYEKDNLWSDDYKEEGLMI